MFVSQFNQILKDHGMSADVKLSWVKQPDGKIFHKKEKEEGEQSCDSDPITDDGTEDD